MLSKSMQETLDKMKSERKPMTTEEYTEAINQINENAENEKNKVIYDYALSNNTVNVGDTVIDQIGPLLVESISVSFGFNRRFPECVYNGTRLTKKMQPRKRNSKGSAFQSNVKRIIRTQGVM